MDRDSGHASAGTLAACYQDWCLTGQSAFWAWQVPYIFMLHMFPAYSNGHMQQHCCFKHHLPWLVWHGICTLLCHPLLQFTHFCLAACHCIELQALALMVPHSPSLRMLPYPCTNCDWRNTYIMSLALANCAICL